MSEPSGGVTQPSGLTPVGVLASRSGRSIFSRRHGAGVVTSLWIGNPNSSCVITETTFGRTISLPCDLDRLVGDHVVDARRVPVRDRLAGQRAVGLRRPA